MKSLLLLTILGISVFAESPEAQEHRDQGLDMQLSTELVFEEMVKIYDYSGQLVKEFQLSEVVNNKITLADHVLIEQSDFAFDYLGDYYYFSEESNLSSLN